MTWAAAALLALPIGARAQIANSEALVDLVSKPGGLTTSEALIKALPMVIVRPIPGQEEWNASHLLRHGAAARAETLDDLTATARALLSHPERLEKMRDNCRGLARPWAAYDAAESLLSLVGEPVLSAPRPALPGADA